MSGTSILITLSTLITSRVEYGAVVWDPHLVKDTHLVETVQRKGARFVSNNYRRTASVTDMINKLGWESLESRREKARLNLMNKIVDDRVAMPLEEYITRGSTRTRSVNNDKFKLYTARTVAFNPYSTRTRTFN